VRIKRLAIEVSLQVIRRIETVRPELVEGCATKELDTTIPRLVICRPFDKLRANGFYATDDKAATMHSPLTRSPLELLIRCKKPPLPHG
jgi:hypothetical protein